MALRSSREMSVEAFDRWREATGWEENALEAAAAKGPAARSI